MSVREYLRLCRVQTSALTAVAPIIGYLLSFSVFAREVIYLVVPLFIVGFFGHIYGNVLNEIADMELDRRSVFLEGKPLVKGTVSVKGAKLTAVLALAISLAMAVYLSPKLIPLLFIALATVCATTYNLWGKRFYGSDFILALGIAAMVFYGYSINGGFPSLFSPVFTISLLSFLQVLFNNSVEGGIKDLENDRRTGIKTMAIMFGCDYENGPELTRSFIAYADAIKLVSILLVFYWLWPLASLPLMLIALLLSIGMLVTLAKFISFGGEDRKKLKRIFSAHEIATYFLTLVLLAAFIPLLWIVLLAAIPLIFYLLSNIALHGNPLSPGV